VFEWDESKNEANIEKHNISFDIAPVLFSGGVVNALSYMSEKRSILINKIGNRIWACIFTLRNENIRIISIRPARINEKKVYYEEENIE
jgi:uncharacterized protein